jgi:hypothetical protein
MSQLGYLSPIDCDVEKLNKILKNKGRMCFVNEQQDNNPKKWLAPDISSEELAQKVSETIINSINDSFKIYVSDEDFYKVSF